ncbi:MAG: hypothetical protein PHR82_03975 [Endomicrobiaceae bacterium]|nr:hypothetical protein [Endomicrobiaceae bacterium]
MNKIKFFTISLCFVCLGVLASCERYPLESLTGVNDRLDSWPETFTIYDDLVKSKGLQDPIVWANSESIEPFNMKCTNEALGYYCIQMGWRDNQNTLAAYAGFGLATRENYKTENIDMTTSGYNYLEFWAKGQLGTDCILRVNIPVPGITNPAETDLCDVTSDDLSPTTWRKFRVEITNKTRDNGWNVLVYYVGVALARKSTAQSTGGVVYIDNIRFTKS